MRNRQRGMTFLGWIFLLTPLVLVGYAALRLTPIYLNYMSVAKAVEQTAMEVGEGPINPAGVRVQLEKHLDIEGISTPNAKDVKIERDGDGWVMIAAYEEVAPIAGNVSLLVQFDKRVKLK
jgi:hypothetical protein